MRQGIGLITDLYDLTIVNVVRPEFEACYGKLSSLENGALTSASHAGAIVGQLFFGMLADRIGRRGTFIATATLMSVSAAGAATVVPFGPLSAVHLMACWRFVLGIGIGGEYPLSGAVTAEKASSEASAVHLASLTLCFLIGQILAPLVALLCLFVGASAQATWRLGIGGGSVLALTGALLRWRGMQESTAWVQARAVQQRQLQRAEESGGHCAGLKGSTLRGIGRPLTGTVLIWFVYDIIGYGTGGYTTSLFHAATREATLLNVLLIVALSAPGYCFTLCVGRLGRRRFLLAGFAGMGLLFLLMGAMYDQSAQTLQVIIFGLQKSFDAFGPGAMTFIIPAEIFPTTVRASCHGVSAAGGKLGAFVGTFLLPAYSEAVGYRVVLQTCALLCLIGTGLTLAFTPPYDARTLARLAAMEAESGGDLSETSQILWGKHSMRRPLIVAADSA